MKKRESVKARKIGRTEDLRREISDLWHPPKIQTDLIPHYPLD